MSQLESVSREPVRRLVRVSAAVFTSHIGYVAIPLIVLCASLAATVTAMAAVFDVSTNAQLDTANARAQVGDQIVLHNGTYASAIAPVNTGSGWGCDRRITFIGNLSTPESVVVASLSLATSAHVTVKGLVVASGVDMGQAIGDSLAQCRFDFGLFIHHADRLMVTRCSSAYQKFSIAHVGGGVADQDTIEYCSWSGLDGRNRPPLGYPFQVGLHGPPSGYCVGLVFRFNRLSISVSGDSAWAAMKRFHVLQSTFYRNRYDVHATYVNPRINEGNLCAWRDSCQDNVVRGDSIFVDDLGVAAGMDEVVPFFVQQGALPGTFERNVIDSCLIKVVRGDAFKAGDRMTNCSFTHNQVMTRDGVAFNLSGSVASVGLSVRHNSFYGSQAIRVDPTPTTSKFISNLLYGRSGGACSEWNTVIHTIYSGGMGIDSSVYYNVDNAPGLAASRGNTCSELVTGVWSTEDHNDEHSSWGDPQLSDSTWGGLDLRVRPGSIAARADLWQDGYVGATRPVASAVSDLSAAWGKTTAALSWTNPLELASLSCGFDLRMSTSPIVTDDDYANAELVATGACAGPGADECHSIVQLEPCTDYYYAVRLSNEAGASAISNVPLRKTRCSGSTEVECTPGFRSSGLHLSVSRVMSASVMRLAQWHAGGLEIQWSDSDIGRPFRLEAFDVSGRRLEVLAQGTAHDDGERVKGATGRAGVVFLRLRVGAWSTTRTLVLVP